jgi:DNA repair protein RecO (recombination protein O)
MILRKDIAMKWTCEGIVLSTRAYSETGVLLEVMTPSRGRHLGLVQGGRSRNKQPLLQAGNSLHLVWNARLEEHLGTFTVEPVILRTDRFMASRAALMGMNYLVSLLKLLPERDPHLGLFRALEVVIDSLHDSHIAAPLLVRFELLMLQELGFGLDLTECAATGARQNLVYVSPKSGRAVSERAGEPWKDKLLPLPAFCAGPAALPTSLDLYNAFELTYFFLSRDIYDARGLQKPASRENYIKLLTLQNS